MPYIVKQNHFKRAAADIGRYGDNDTLPFDIDKFFVDANQEALSAIAFKYFCSLDNDIKKAGQAIDSLSIFHERLLTPTGPTGFRITTKIHPFWNIYLNGLGVAIAETLEPRRDGRAHSYRFAAEGDSLFDRTSSWRSYLQATIDDEAIKEQSAFVVKTDISSFYEHIYHHRLETNITDLFPKDRSTVAIQIDRILNQFSGNRSFGLPVGGQCARTLAELLMQSVDQQLSADDVIWHRYVDDFTLIAANQSDAYRALSALSHTLAAYGLSLNRTKTTLLTAKHYVDYVGLQLGTPDDSARRLREIDLHFDPYSHTSDADYDELSSTIEQLEVQALLDLELQKSQPDAFLVTQIGRTLELHPPKMTLQLCNTLLSAQNLHAFRGSWSSIMRGVASVRNKDEHRSIHPSLDLLLDQVPDHSPHLLLPDANRLHYLQTIRFQRTDARARYVNHVYDASSSTTVKRACIDCWRNWADQESFRRRWNQWGSLDAEQQRMLWLASFASGDEGDHFRKRLRSALPNAWRLGIEPIDAELTFASIYKQWAENGV